MSVLVLFSHKIFVIFTTILMNFVEYLVLQWRDFTMTDNEKELLDIIHENDNPTRALTAAALIVLGHLKQHGSSEEPVAVGLRELS